MKNIISASRRTDIPAFYYDWLQECLKNEEVEICNPLYKENKTIVDLSPDKIHSIVLWSKNYSNLIKNIGYLKYYNLYFQYTITGYSKVFEPNVPTMEESIKTIEKLLEMGFAPEQFNIRFDPIILSESGEINPNYEKPGKARLDKFNELLSNLKAIGMDNCRVTTSYISMYNHVKKNMNKTDMINIDNNIQIEFMRRLAAIADNFNRDIYVCSNERFLNAGITNIKKSHCIDGDLLDKLFNEKSSKAKCTGQRKECGCSKSIDIGNYYQKCYHNCIYCYAMK